MENYLLLVEMEYHVVDQILECSSISTGGSNVEYSLEEDLVFVVDFVVLENDILNENI